MRSPPLPEAIAALVIRHRRWLLLALLALLHLVLVQGPDGAIGRLIFVVEIGLAILWQPFVRAEQRLSLLAASFVAAGITAAVFWLDWWMLAVWIMLSAGIVGGKVFFYASRWSKLFYLLALGYLVVALLLIVVPRVVPEVVLPGDAISLVLLLLPGLFVVMALLPEERESDEGGEAIDFIYSVFVFLLLAVLALGSLAAMQLFRSGYAEALFEALITVGLLLLALGWAWNPHAGFSGVGSLFSRYLLSIGLPVEQWLHTLADLAQRGDDPQRFLTDACADMVRRLPWIKGGDWSDGESAGEFGVRTARRTEFRHGSLILGIYTRHALSPALVWHFNLLAQLLGEFHDDKRRSRKLRQLGYIQAVHETGARLTHDVKNLLQSLNALCAASEAEGDHPSAELTALLRRQLPVIAQRLGNTLEKLQAPREETGETVSVCAWFDGICSRYSAQGVTCALAVEAADVALPVAMFNGTAENLLQNAIDKRRVDKSLAVHLQLGLADGKPVLDVTDSGAAIPESVAMRLLHEPVASENGLGIGLYQAARLAELNGYRLELAENRPGCVRFRLAAAALKGTA
jgi:hypothetical protein